ncbi:hypothetical protein [Pelagibius sp.]|uniref:hypothetical protein n=1 Tax=Pelagibius sp. TaxID=1931238 RepID=UPI0026268A6E|nr:hypothetical protein [Pelagibius sp.]
MTQTVEAPGGYRPEPKRALYGYMAGAGFAVVAIPLFLGLRFPNDTAFLPMIFAMGVGVAFFAGIFLFVPVYALLASVSQLRLWWAILTGYAFLVGPAAILGGSDDFWTHLVLLGRDSQGELSLDYGLMFLGAVGAAGGLLGWIVAYGFRLRPEPKPRDVSKVFD